MKFSIKSKMYLAITALLCGMLSLSACGGGSDDPAPTTTPTTTTTYDIRDYLQITPGEIKVYQGTWDSNDVRIEVSQNATGSENINGTIQTTYLTDNYNYYSGSGANFTYTAYEYGDSGEWTLWKEVDSGGNENVINFPLAYTQMEIGDIITSASGSSELLEASQMVFPELGSTALEYLKFRIIHETTYWMVYYVKGYGEYVLQPNSDVFANVQKYLVYSQSSSSTKGTKPSWFDGIVGSLSSSSAFSIADLAGTWQLDSNCEDGTNDTGSFTYLNDGSFTATMTDEDGASWSESGSSSITGEGAVTMDFGNNYFWQLTMNVAKDTMTGDNDGCTDVLTK